MKVEYGALAWVIMMKFLVLLGELKKMRVFSGIARQTAKRWENNALLSKYNLRLDSARGHQVQY